VPGLHKPAAAIIAAVVLLAGCTPATTPTAGSSGEVVGGIRISAVPGIAVDRQTFEPVSPTVKGLTDGLAGGDLTPYLKQKLTWTDCDSGTRCAEILAPLDYANPATKAVTIALRMKPATKSPKLGSLFINPGGPGGSGKELVDSFQTTGLEQYDIVGWDPRGAGDSTPVRCLSDAEADAYLDIDASPDDDAERATLIKAGYDFAKACWERNGDLLNHIGTVETVRDLDLLRQLLGNKKLNFLGYSYGTQIGATYAELFGTSTGRLVLDAAVNITDDDSVIQAQGFDLALGNFASWCAQSTCGLGDSKEAVLAAITGLFDRLDANPLTVGDRKLTQSLAVSGVAVALYGGKDSWSPLSVLLQRAIKGEGKYLLYAADQMNFRDESGHYDAMFFAFPAISCLDTKEKGVLDADRVWKEDQTKAPIFGKYFGPGYACALWSVRPSEYLQLHLKGASAQPLVVIGGTGDNATPIQYARSMAKQLVSAVLVTYEGEGHGGYGGKSACVDKLVVNYLAHGRVPANGTTCT
jgi:pimeloyl-ACP methyl ester carboxylesterase